jgi:tripartite ATP-independent transporter DctP family solute receptor
MQNLTSASGKVGTPLLLATAVFFAASGSAQAAETIKIAHYFAEDHPQNIALKEKFVPMVEKNTDFEVQIFPNSELGDERQYTNGVRNGSIEMVVAGMGLQTAEPKIGFTEWPFLFETYDQANNLLNGAVGDEIEPLFRKLGTEPLGWTANGFRVFSSNRPIENMEDFEGLRLRMPNLKLYVDVGQALGANVQTLGFSEVFTALEQGVVDGQDNPYATLYNSGWYEVQSDVLESRHMFSPNIYLMNKEFFDGLTAEDQEVIRTAAQESLELEWEMMKNSEEEIKAKLKEEGLNIRVPSEEFRQKMVDAVAPVYKDLYAKYDWAEALVNKVESSAAQ